MRYSKNLRDKLSTIQDIDEKRLILCCIYINSTSLQICADLFQCNVQYIIDTLIQEDMFEYKICSKCSKLKPFVEFYSNQSMGISINRCGLSCHCRQCVSDFGKKYFQTNRDKKYQYCEDYRKQSKFKTYKSTYDKSYKSQDHIKSRIAEIANFRYHNDPKFHIRTVMSTSIRNCLIYGKQKQSTENILGYSIDVLKNHLESLFDDNMTWDNHGTYWEIDHIIPIDYFNFTNQTDSDFKACWNLENLQPLEKLENRRKSNKIDD